MGSSHQQPPGTRPEQLIGALVPPTTRRPAPTVPLGAPALRRRGWLTDVTAEPVLFDVARIDTSGRFCARALLTALRWEPGHRLDLTVETDAVVFGSSPAGRQTVGRRGELTVPVAARSLAGLDAEARVMLVAVPTRDLLVAHPPALVAHLLARHYAHQATGHDDG
ncbi:hypothetical protein Aph02nite_10270 [Actinoplanes philippinensis]|nr:hypothetical protein [Actinoplanes philippinensis]GIE75077.1 hypothetical protein Aph02nite_10270 [Actinoplanes philippinensis]